eukprot:COSAG01_NODE_7553_length_3153_cov_9.276686_1_plen_203_part_00
MLVNYLSFFDGTGPAALGYCHPSTTPARSAARPNNVLRVTYFVIDSNQLDSHHEAAFQYEVVKRPDDTTSQFASLVRLISDKSALQKQLATIKTANSWYTGAVALGNYASRTTPPIIPQVALLAYMEYADFFKRLMTIYGADNDEKTMKVFLRFDEDFRLSLARTCAPQDMLWDVRSYSKFTDLQIRLTHPPSLGNPQQGNI